MKFKLKKYFPISRAGNKMCIGIPNSENYVEIPYSEKVYQEVEHLILNGAVMEEIASLELYSKLYGLNMLDEMKSFHSRKELYFEYSNIDLVHEDTLSKKIMIFGAGAGGSTLCYMLAQLGFTKLVIIDRDMVKESDTQKSFAYRHSDIGKKKTLVLRETLKKSFSIHCETIEEMPITEQEIQQIIASVKPQIIIKACDPSLKFRYFLNEICFKERIPFFYMAYSFDNLIIGPLFDPLQTCCDRSINEMIKESFGDDHDFIKHERLFDDQTIHPSINFNINILSSLALKEILFFLIGDVKRCISYGKQIIFNPISLSGASIKLLCNDFCPYKIKL